MATSTFERKIEINDLESLRKLESVMMAEAPDKELSVHPFSDTERDRSEALLRRFLSRSSR